ncbi:uncharacterized protein LOC116616129 [Nematostella vectensis]|uniref:uncharacterized protein LOC116616129 n=1 Tax=Nematostella vectensis TaxID=45351 RepID=UPI00138FCB42|nr:uncharacterized protein LOC116616129 [Nematostella vectensis]
MAKALLLVLAAASALLMSCQAWIDVKDRIKGRVIHLETLLQRGRWLWQNDNLDADGSRYFFIDELPERDTYYHPRVQFMVTECNSYLCLEPLSLRDYYLAAGFPAGVPNKYTVKLQHSVYPAGDIRFFWKFLCEDETLEKCKVVPIRFESEGWLMVADNWGNPNGYNGGHYDATLGKDLSDAYFRIHAPNPTDGYNVVYSNSNTGTSEQSASYSVTMGVSKTHTTSHTVTVTVSIEVGGAFKAFSASASTTISNSWATTDSTTFSTSKTVQHSLTLPPRTTIILKQLIGHYAGEFDVGDDQFMIEEIPLDGGPARRRIVRISPSGQQFEEPNKLAMC